MTLTQISKRKAFLKTLPILLFLFLLSVLTPFVGAEICLELGYSMKSVNLLRIGVIISFIVVGFLFFKIFHTGQIYKYRHIIFVAMAIGLTLNFLPGMYEQRGAITLHAEEIICGKVPVCFIVIPQVILPLIFDGVSIFPAAISSVVSQAILLLAIMLVLGRGWCSWFCFWGGWEEGCSGIRKKALFKLPAKLRHIPFAVLAAVVLTSLTTLTATYCYWVCPFKAVSEFAQVTDSLVIFQTVTFSVLFLGLCIVLPILTKKRTQCISLCPLGATLSLFEKFAWSKVSIDRKKCMDCKLCIKECHMNAITEDSLKEGKTLSNCVKCGKCIDICKKQAVKFTIMGKFNNTRLAKNLFLYPAMLLLGFMSLNYFGLGLARIINLFTTGSILLG